MSQAKHAIVGDIHGDIDALELMSDKITADRHLVFLGDYVNRGPHSRDVIEALLDLREHRHCTFLMGNHEQALLEFLRGGSFTAFGAMGGLHTLRSYLGPHPPPDVAAEFRQSFPHRHRDFIDALKFYWNSDGLLVSHAGIDPSSPDDRTIESLVLTSHPELFSLDKLPINDILVVGHYVQRSAKPYVSESLICLDTGCGSLPHGKLTALLWPERVFVQT